MNEQTRYMPADQRRAATAETVVDLAAEQNPADITTAAIAERMGLSQGAIFRHFPTKAAMLEAAMGWVSERLLARIDKAAAEAASPVAALEAMFFTHVEFVARYPGVPRMLFGELQRPGETLPKKMVKTMIGRYRERLGRTFAAGREQGEFAPDLDDATAAALFIGTIQGLVMQSLLVGDPRSIRAAAEPAFRIYLRGIEPRP